LLRWALANVVTGNRDAHAETVSILQHEDGTRRLAPDDGSSTPHAKNLSTITATTARHGSCSRAKRSSQTVCRRCR